MATSASALCSAIAPTISVLEPGLVHIRGALTQSDQEWLANVAFEEGERNGGFYEDRKLNSTRSRGRIYDTLARFPEGTREVCMTQVARACSADWAMPAMSPTHLLLLKYSTEKGMGFHRDNSENDGAGDFPVVSLSVGNTSVFAVKHERHSVEKTIVLESGDAVIFGGPCRQALHAVTQVFPNTAPCFLPRSFVNARLNFTFRHAPEVLGREKMFEFFKAGNTTSAGHALNFDNAVGQQEGLQIAVGEPRRLCPRDGMPRTRAQFAARHGGAWKRSWDAAPAGPASASGSARIEAEQALEKVDIMDPGTERAASDAHAGEHSHRRRWRKANG